MGTGNTDIWVYADWVELNGPKLVGVLTAQQAKGRKAFSFEYDKQWLLQPERILLDPDLQWYSGRQYPSGKENFGLIMDSMPDAWGKALMRRKATHKALQEGRLAPVLYEVDYLLGVYDESRMGALRFKTDPDGYFLDYNPTVTVPPWVRVKELQHSALELELSDDLNTTYQWLEILIAPGSSLGGARPKANVLDANGHPWIAKFPSKNDAIDKAAWEFVAYTLALKSGIIISTSRIDIVSGPHHTFFTKRFDRANNGRIHFASAMTMTNFTEEMLRDNIASYLDIAEFIQFSCSNVKQNLHQLWRRIVFNIAISNTDDHLRNHGFIIRDKGWILSPAYDLNPSVDKNGLALNIDMDNNALDFELAKSVGEYFQLSLKEMNAIVEEVKAAVKEWRKVAIRINISKQEIDYMERCFQF
ncbi:MAG: HipA domain-containing protein [Lentimicrobium sp.]|nr:HipA domain-containing protein [Lentimicrobium sp.]